MLTTTSMPLCCLLRRPARRWICWPGSGTKQQITPMRIGHLASTHIHAGHAKRALRCTASSNTTSTTPTTNFASADHTDAVHPIGYATVQASIGKLSAEPRVVCLDSDATHILVGRSLVANHTALAGETLQIHGISSGFTSSEHVSLRLYIDGDDGKSKAFVVFKVYLVEESAPACS